MMDFICVCETCHNSEICKYKDTLNKKRIIIQTMLIDDDKFLEGVDVDLSSILNITIGCDYWQKKEW